MDNIDRIDELEAKSPEIKELMKQFYATDGIDILWLDAKINEIVNAQNL